MEALTGDARKAALQLAQQTQWRNKAVSDLYEQMCIRDSVIGPRTAPAWARAFPGAAKSWPSSRAFWKIWSCKMDYREEFLQIWHQRCV